MQIYVHERISLINSVGYDFVDKKEQQLRINDIASTCA